MMKLIRTIGMVALLLLPASPAFAQSAGIEWDILNQEAMSLYQKGQYDRAVTVAKKVLEDAEKSVGKNHLNVALSLNNLAALYQTQGQYAQAEPLYKRSLAIGEKAIAPDHSDGGSKPEPASATAFEKSLDCLHSNGNSVCIDKESQIYKLLYQKKLSSLTSLERHAVLMLFGDKLVEVAEENHKRYAIYNLEKHPLLSSAWTSYVHDSLLKSLDKNINSVSKNAFLTLLGQIPKPAIDYWFSLLKDNSLDIVIDDRGITINSIERLVTAISDPKTKTIYPILRRKLQDFVGLRASDQELVEGSINKLNKELDKMIACLLGWLKNDPQLLKEVRKFIEARQAMENKLVSVQNESSLLTRYIADKPRFVYITHGKHHPPFVEPAIGNLYISDEDVRRIEKSNLMRQLFEHESSHVLLSLVPVTEQFELMVELFDQIIETTESSHIKSEDISSNKQSQQIIEEMTKIIRSFYGPYVEVSIDVAILSEGTENDKYLALLQSLLPRDSARLKVNESLIMYFSECNKRFNEDEFNKINIMWASATKNSNDPTEQVFYIADLLSQLLEHAQSQSMNEDATIFTRAAISLFDTNRLKSFYGYYANFQKAREILARSLFYDNVSAYLISSLTTGEM